MTEGFCRGDIVTGGFCDGGILLGGYCDEGILSGGFWDGGILSGGFLSRGIFAVGFFPGRFCRGDFILEPSVSSTLQHLIFPVSCIQFTRQPIVCLASCYFSQLSFQPVVFSVIWHLSILQPKISSASHPFGHLFIQSVIHSATFLFGQLSVRPNCPRMSSFTH